MSRRRMLMAGYLPEITANITLSQFPVPYGYTLCSYILHVDGMGDGADAGIYKNEVQMDWMTSQQEDTKTGSFAVTQGDVVKGYGSNNHSVIITLT